jgi:hypothetical protein
MYIPSCGWRVYRTEIWECEKILVRRGHTSILSQERTHLDPVSGEDTPRSCLRTGHTLIPARRGHTSIPARRRQTSILARRGHTSIPARRRQTSILARRGHTLILARRGHTSILARRGTHLNPGQERTHLDLRENISMANSILLRCFEARSLDSEKNEENQWN